MLNGTGLPKIVLYTGAAVMRTLDFGSFGEEDQREVLNIFGLDPRWDPEYDTEPARMSNSGRTLKNYQIGWRFRLTMDFTDLFLSKSYLLSAYAGMIEWYVSHMANWLLTDGNSIRVYPYRDNATLYYDCLLETYSQSNIKPGNIQLTIANNYVFSLVSKTIVTSKPLPAYPPWI